MSPCSIRPPSLRCQIQALIYCAPSPDLPAPNPSLPLPPNPASALAHLRHNLSLSKIHYVILLWISLLSLAPHHYPTMLFLMAASKFMLLYEVIKKVVPASWRLLHRVLNQRVVLEFFLGMVLVEFWATGLIARLRVAMSVEMGAEAEDEGREAKEVKVERDEGRKERWMTRGSDMEEVENKRESEI